MNPKKMKEQALLLRQKKAARMSRIAKQLRPTVKDGVVRYEKPPAPIRQSAVAPPQASVRTTRQPKQIQQYSVEQQQQIQQQRVAPKKGCSGCQRKLGNK